MQSVTIFYTVVPKAAIERPKRAGRGGRRDYFELHGGETDEEDLEMGKKCGVAQKGTTGHRKRRKVD